MLKISYAGCLGLSPAISSQFSVEMCAASKNCEKTDGQTDAQTMAKTREAFCFRA